MTGFNPGVRSSLVRLRQRAGRQALLLQGRREGRDAAEGDGGGPHGYRGRARVKGQNKSGQRASSNCRFGYCDLRI